MFGQETVQDTSTKRKSTKRVKKKTHRLSAPVAALASKNCSKYFPFSDKSILSYVYIILHFLILCVYQFLFPRESWGDGKESWVCSQKPSQLASQPVASADVFNGRHANFRMLRDVRIQMKGIRRKRNKRKMGKKFQRPDSWHLNVFEVSFSQFPNLNMVVRYNSIGLCGLSSNCCTLRHGYGSIPINTIFSGMNIHLPAILMFTRGTRFWHTATLHTQCTCLFLLGKLRAIPRRS